MDNVRPVFIALVTFLALINAPPALAQCDPSYQQCTSSPEDGPFVSITPVDGTMYVTAQPVSVSLVVTFFDPDTVDLRSARVTLTAGGTTSTLSLTASSSPDGSRVTLRGTVTLRHAGANVIDARAADRYGSVGSALATYQLNTNGYWLSVHSDHDDQPVRLQSSVQVDLPLDEQRSVYVGVVVPPSDVVLCHQTIQAQVSGTIAPLVSVAREVRTTQRLSPGGTWSRYSIPTLPAGVPIDNEDSIILVPLAAPIDQCLSSTPIALDAEGTRSRPAEYRLWLRFGATATAGTYTGTLSLDIHGKITTVPLEMTVWPVRLPNARPFDVYGYGDLLTFAGINNAAEVNAQTTATLTAKVDAYAAAGGNVLSFAGGNTIRGFITYGPNRQPMPVPSSYSLDNLPALDFTHYDPWFDYLRSKVKRVETYVDLLPVALGQQNFPLTLLETPVALGSPEHKKVLRWWLEQLKAYLVRRGFTEGDGFYCKIADEIGPEHIAAYNETADVVRQAGWHPYTSFIPPLSRSSDFLTAMVRNTDLWRMGFGTRDTFRKLNTEKYRLEWKEVIHTGAWAQYTNGGALDTWQLGAIYGTDASGLPRMPDVDRTLLLQSTAGGVPLHVREGESPWGNRRLDAAFPLNTTLYAARVDGLRPLGSELRVRYNQTTQVSGHRRVWSEASLGFIGHYTNGGAVDTGAWSMGTFDYAAFKPNKDQFLALQTLSPAGAPLLYAGQYPWGNRRWGVHYRSGSTLYAALHDGRAPGNLLTLRYSRIAADGSRVWTDAPLTTIGQYTNGGAVGTWGFTLPAAATGSDVEHLLVLQNVSAAGLPLEQYGVSAWGNRKLGVSFIVGQTAWVAPRDGSAPGTITVRYHERTPDPVNGAILMTRKPGDETWFYAGMSHTSALAYETVLAFPLLAAVEKPHGYALWAFQWWDTNRLVWTDGPNATLSSGPAYAGMRDGWRDAILVDHAVRTRGVITLGEVASTSYTSLLPLTMRATAEDATETYPQFTDVTHPRVNDARRELLRRLSQP